MISDEKNYGEYVKSFKYLTGTPEELDMHGSAYFITNINEFKDHAFFYPANIRYGASTKSLALIK